MDAHRASVTPSTDFATAEPGGLAARQGPDAPLVGQGADQQEAPPALVEGAGDAGDRQPGVAVLDAELDDIVAEAHDQAAGPRAWRTALVTSSLTSSTAVSTWSLQPAPSSTPAVKPRVRATLDGHGLERQPVDAGRRLRQRTRATRMARSSSRVALAGTSASSSASQSTSASVTPARWAAAGQPVEPGLERLVPPLDQAVGVEHEQVALPQLGGGLRHAGAGGDAEEHAAALGEERRRAVAQQQGWRVAGVAPAERRRVEVEHAEHAGGVGQAQLVEEPVDPASAAAGRACSSQA